MNIYLLEQSVNSGYDTFDYCVVIAPNKEVAKTIHPSPSDLGGVMYIPVESRWVAATWTNNADDVTATLIGVSFSDTVSVVCSSFNAG